MPKVNVNRFMDHGQSDCAICSCASLASYYNPEITYDFVYSIAEQSFPDISEGLDSGEIALLLNYLGFQKTTIVSANINYLDFSWARLKRKSKIYALKHASRNAINYQSVLTSFYKWLRNYNYDNNLIVDYNFSKHIKKSINRKKPLIASFNWSLFFKMPKTNEKGAIDVLNGEAEEHAVVVYGYSKKNVYVCDSHYGCYTYRLKKYRKGYYPISFENLMSVMSFGDLIMAEDYV